MIENVYKKIKTELIDLNLMETKDFFDSENIPDSLIDKSFLILPCVLSNGDYSGSSTSIPILNVSALIGINIYRKIPVNKLNDSIINASVMVEKVIKNITSIVVGENELDKIEFAGADVTITSTFIVYAVNFNCNYRI